MSQLGFISRSRGVRGGNGTSGCDIFKRKLVFKRNEIFLGFVLLSFCINGGLGQSAEVVNDGNVKIEDRIKSFLNSHCNKQNQTLEQEEYEIFIRCNPTQAAMIIRNIDSHKESDLGLRHKEIQKEIDNQCNAWPTKRSCQRKNFKLIEKCFDGQQKFVFYFLLALTDTICQDGDHFIEFWEKGGNKCLNEHLMKLTQEISECLTVTSTMTKDELDKNIDKITGCIGDKFSDCGSPESNQVIQNLLRDIESFYNEIKASASTSSASSLSIDGAITFKIIISFSLFIVMSMQLQSVHVFR